MVTTMVVVSASQLVSRLVSEMVTTMVFVSASQLASRLVSRMGISMVVVSASQLTMTMVVLSGCGLVQTMTELVPQIVQYILLLSGRLFVVAVSL